MNEVQSCVTQIGQEGTHYTQRERERERELDGIRTARMHQLLLQSCRKAALIGLKKKKNVSAHNESLANGHIHLWLNTEALLPLRSSHTHKGTFSLWQILALTFQVQLWDSPSSLNHKFTQTDVCKWYGHCSERCSCVLWRNGSMQGLK